MLPIATVCSWCDLDHAQTKALIAQGYDVSHTICEPHRQQFMRDEFKVAV